MDNNKGYGGSIHNILYYIKLDILIMYDVLHIQKFSYASNKPILKKITVIYLHLLNKKLYFN